MDIRKIILKRLEQLGWSKYKLSMIVDPTKKKQRIIYAFLAGETTLNSDDLATIFDAVTLDLKPK